MKKLIKKIYNRSREMLSINKEKINKQHDDIRKLSAKRSFQEVLDAYEKKKIKSSRHVLNTIGYCYFQTSQYQEALRALKKYSKMHPNDYYSTYFSAHCFSLLNNSQQAITFFTKSLFLKGANHSEILDHLLPLLTKELDQIFVDSVFADIISSSCSEELSDLALARIFFAKKDDEKVQDLKLADTGIYYIKNAKQVSSETNSKLQNFPPERIRYINFKNIDSSWVDTQNDIWVDSPPLYVLELLNAKVNSGSSLIISESDIALSETLSHPEFGQYVEMRRDPTVKGRRSDALFIQSFPSATKKISRAIMLAGAATDAYGHWFAEHLPKLRFIQQHPEYKDTPIIVDEGMPDSHFDFLKLLSNNPIIILKKNSSIEVENLIVASTDTFFPIDLTSHHKVPLEHQSGMTVGGLSYFKKKIETKIPPVSQRPQKRIFLSRKASQWRKISNEAELIDMLKKYDFESIQIENFSFEEQIRIFQNAHLIVAPNGSAVNNLIFSPPTSKTLLLGQRGIYNWGTWFGSFKELGYQIEYMSGKTTGEGKHLDYEISAKLLEEKVKYLLDNQDNSLEL